MTIRDPNFKDICRQRPLPAPTCTARELTRAALDILDASWRPGAPIRALTLTAHNLVDEDGAAEQLDLFDPQAPLRRGKAEKLERTMDALRAKYGHDILSSGLLTPSPRQEEDPEDLPF